MPQSSGDGRGVEAMPCWSTVALADPTSLDAFHAAIAGNGHVKLPAQPEMDAYDCAQRLQN